jgi:3-oxoacyl-[acyl-carrier protein] reductase
VRARPATSSEAAAARLYIRPGIDPDDPDTPVAVLVVDPGGTPGERAVVRLGALCHELQHWACLLQTDGWAEHTWDSGRLTVHVAAHPAALSAVGVAPADFPHPAAADPRAVTILHTEATVGLQPTTRLAEATVVRDQWLSAALSGSLPALPEIRSRRIECAIHPLVRLGPQSVHGQSAVSTVPEGELIAGRQKPGGSDQEDTMRGALQNKTALVTGGSRGIGRAIALHLASDGARVAVHYGNDEAAAKETVALIETAGGRAFAVRAAFGTQGAVDQLFTQLQAELADGEGLDILVNNAGIGSTHGITEVTEGELNRLLTVNVATPLLAIQRALPLLRDGGRIINIGSAASRMAVSIQIGYTASKAALEALAPTLTNDLGRRGITVNTVTPGVIRTDLTQHLLAIPELAAGMEALTALGRVGEPDDVADIVAFLASPQARWITGQTIDASGGTWLGPIAPAA